MRLITFAFGTAVLISISSLNASELYKCRDEKGSKFGVELLFSGTKLEKLVVNSLPIKSALEKYEYARAQLDGKSYGSYSVDITDITDIDESYLRIMFAKRGSVEDSIVGDNYAIDGTPYAKLRVDVSFEAAMEEYGTTYYMKCIKF